MVLAAVLSCVVLTVCVGFCTGCCVYIHWCCYDWSSPQPWAERCSTVQVLSDVVILWLNCECVVK